MDVRIGNYLGPISSNPIPQAANRVGTAGGVNAPSFQALVGGTEQTAGTTSPRLSDRVQDNSRTGLQTLASNPESRGSLVDILV